LSKVPNFEFSFEVFTLSLADSNIGSFYVILTAKSVEEIIRCYHSNKNCWAALSLDDNYHADNLIPTFTFISKDFVIQKQVKINAGKIERRFGVVMTPFSSSK